MPIAGQGVVPPSGGLYNELTAVTRREFVPRLFVQMYYSTPTLYHLFGNAQKAQGGLSQITIPMQGQSMVQGQFVGYGGGFNAPVVTPGIQNGQFPLSYWVVPIPLPFGESVIQASAREVSLLRARMNDAYAVTWQNMATLAYSNNSANSLLPNSFYDAFDDGTNVTTYGGINRTTSGNSAFRGQYINAATWSSGSSSVGAVGFTRASLSSLLTKITDGAGGEMPSFAVMNPADFATLNKDFIGAESYQYAPGMQFTPDTQIRSSFPNLNVAGVPIFADHFTPQGQMFVVNTKYTQMYLSEDAAFDFSGFYSMIPVGQIGQQGLVIVGYNIVSAKSSSGAFVYGIGGNAY